MRIGLKMLGISLLVAAASAVYGAQSLQAITGGPMPRAREIFHVGEFNGASGEFAEGSPHQTVRVDASSPNAASAWFAFQPETGATGADRQATDARVIAFSLTGATARAYTLRVGLLIEHASVPALRLSVNGHEGRFFLDPVIDSRVDGGAAVFFPSFSVADIRLTIPGSFLHQGANELAFSAVRADEGGEVPDAGFFYDAIQMTEGETTAPKIRLTPTVFYREQAGRLQEGIDLTIRTDGGAAESAALIVNGKRERVLLDPHRTWGEQRTRIYIPAPEQPMQAQVELEQAAHVTRVTELLRPAKRWTVYVVPHVHLDIGYTDYQAKVASVQSRVIDEALDLFSIHPDFRFSVDGEWSLEHFLSTRQPVDRTRALDAIRANQLFIPAEYCNMLTGFASGETIVRSLYPTANFSRENKLPIHYTSITDVPSFSWSYASILAAAGIPELVAGSNNGRAPVLLRGHLDQESPYYWEGPDGGKVLMWYSHHYHQLWTTFGLPAQMAAGEETLPLFLQNYGRPTYKANAVIMYGTQVENTDLFPEQASFAKEWNARYAYPHLKYAGFHEALDAIAADYHGDLPIVRGDGGPYWEDGIAADAQFAAIERENEHRGPAAEELATLSSIANPRIAPDKDRLDAMWKSMVLMDEHTWLSAASYSDYQNDQATIQLGVKDANATAAQLLADRVARRSMADLADVIDLPAHSLVVFNTLMWPRSGLVAVDLPKGERIVDRATAHAVPMTVADHGEHTARATFRAEDVPAAGYKTYLLEDGPVDASQPIEGQTLENDFYRVELDPASGAVRSIYDKQLNRELVDAANPYKFGQYLYVTTEKDAHGADSFVVHNAQQGHIIRIEKTALGITAYLESTDLRTPKIEAAITLMSHEKKIEFREDVDKQPTTNDEAAYFAFPFAMSQPEFEYEIQNGSVDPSRDMYPGAGLDWFSVQHWAAVQQDGIAAAVLPRDASLMTFGDITRVNFPETFKDRRGTIFSYVMNNYWRTNYRAVQGGHFVFRFTVTSAPQIDPAALSRLGREESTQLEVNEVTASDKAVPLKRPLDGKSGSFLQTEDRDLSLEAWKAAEDGRGEILRFVDLGGPERTVRIDLPFNEIEHAWEDDAIERDQHELELQSPHTLSFHVKPHAIVTLRIVSQRPAVPPCGRFCDTERSLTQARSMNR